MLLAHQTLKLGVCQWFSLCHFSSLTMS